METFTQALAAAFGLLLGLDPDLLGIVRLSLQVSLAAVFLAALTGIPIGAAAAMAQASGPLQGRRYGAYAQSSGTGNASLCFTPAGS